MHRHSLRFLVTALILIQPAAADEPLRWIREPASSFDAEAKTWSVAFEPNRFADVEVAVLDPAGKVVRHLAAGVLGKNPPPPLQPDACRQKIAWDGRDDDGLPVPQSRKCTFRVRAGMSVRLDRLVGGDPYAYFSAEMPHGDHSPWGINGLELKPDGKVYVLGHSSTLGPPALRRYDLLGNYLGTVFPPPAGRPVESMRGWGLNLRPDGTYTPKFNRLTDPSLSTTILDTGTGGMARLFPNPDPHHLSVWQTGFGGASFTLQSFGTDGSLPAKPAAAFLTGKLVEKPAMPFGPVAPGAHLAHALIGPVFTCFAPDGKHFYLSGIFAAKTLYGSIKEIDKDGVWRDGQVWKVDRATRTARVFFALDSKEVAAASRDRESPIGGRHSYAALHGVAVDGEGRVFLCDRLNQRILVLDDQAKILRVIPVRHPDAVALGPRLGSLYVTTRIGDERTGRGHVDLLKFTDWRRDTKPAVSLRVSETGYTGHHKHSHLVVGGTAQETILWVAYTETPVRIYRDDGTSLALVKDFLERKDAQRCLGFDRIEVDPATDAVFVLDDHTAVWRVSDWKDPRFDKLPLKTASIALDPRRRHLYIRTLADGSSSYSVGKVARYHLDRPGYPPADFGDAGTNRLTPAFHHEWCFTGNGDKGFAVAPNGNVAVVGDPKDGLRLFHGTAAKLPWQALKIADLPTLAGGIRFDRSGNLYVGYLDRKPTALPAGFEKDRYSGMLARIHKFAPTGSLEIGNLFPTVPKGPTRSYDVHFGAFDADCIVRSPRFALDGFGRLHVPTNILPQVVILDDAGNEILRFGTYGNRDSTGGLTGDLVPTKGIPLGFPNSVAATDDHLYVGDMVNHRLLRIEKRFVLTSTTR